jgi:topoisomerase-4 subunit B
MMSKKIVYENEEFNLLQAALDIEDDMENLRYNNIVIATMPMLMEYSIIIDYFSFSFSRINKRRALYMQTPLFRVQQRKKPFTVILKMNDAPPSKN